MNLYFLSNQIEFTMTHNHEPKINHHELIKKILTNSLKNLYQLDEPYG